MTPPRRPSGKAPDEAPGKATRSRTERTRGWQGGTRRRGSLVDAPRPWDRLGAIPLGENSCSFTVWAPAAEEVAVELLPATGGDVERVEALQALEHGMYSAILEDVEPGRRYRYRLATPRGALSRPDPASRSQPEGVHGPSRVVELEEPRMWTGRPLEEYVIYELHVGTFTSEGTFDAIIPRLDDLCELGITAIELMPVAEFPGGRNWGYDGVFPFAVQSTYGGPHGLQRLVEACHARDLAVVLDVVYNHLGPEGNSLADFGPYFTDRYRTPWGDAINFDGGGSDAVRRFFIENSRYWTGELGIDALRLDAVHAILDTSALHILEALAGAVEEEARRARRHVLVIAESDANDPRLIHRTDRGGYGFDALWSDDFHHALHALVTGESRGYYRDFGTMEQLADALRYGYVYRGDYSVFRDRAHGRDPGEVPSPRFLAYAQNHDQVGNRARGDRLSTLVDFETSKAVAAITLLSPFTPLLFMGEEYGETAPFPYFVSHSDPALVEAVRRGRGAEFAAFGWEGVVPDPQAEATFHSARPDPSLRERKHHGVLRALHRELIALRHDLRRGGVLASQTRLVEAVGARALLMLRTGIGREALFLLNLGEEPVDFQERLPWGEWVQRISTAESRWLGPGAPTEEDRRFVLPRQSAALFLRDVRAGGDRRSRGRRSDDPEWSNGDESID